MLPAGKLDEVELRLFIYLCMYLYTYLFMLVEIRTFEIPIHRM